jgi:hypothetical protein
MRNEERGTRNEKHAGFGCSFSFFISHFSSQNDAKRQPCYRQPAGKAATQTIITERRREG